MKFNPIKLMGSFWQRYLLILMFLIGAISVFIFRAGLEYSSTDDFCASCHVHPNSTTTWRQGAHFDNKSGVVVHCVECHLPPKGFAYLVDALGKLTDVGEIQLLVSGNGQPDLGLDPQKFKIRFLGPLYDEGLQRLAFAASDLFVFPTLADNHPLVLLEALACGTPVVSFDVGGVPEIVRHVETGYLAKYKDSTDLANGITMLLGNDKLRNQMRHRCRETAEREFSLDLQCKRYLEVYEKAKEDFQQKCKS